jgi:hypothetical protein
MPIEIRGLRELRAELKALETKAPREVTAALRVGAVQVAARANELAPRGRTGRLAADGRPYATMRSAGVRYTLIYAPVQEFAVDWLRRNRGGTAKSGSVSRGEKGAHFGRGATVAGTNEVHYTKNGSPPRFAFKAVEQLGPRLIDETFERLVGILRAHGWFR